VQRSVTATYASQPHQSFECSRSQTWFVTTVVAGVLTLAYAAPFGSLNQATYLLDPLWRAEPQLFARDWFVAETSTYMVGFGRLAQWLFVIDHEGVIAFVAAHIVVALASYAAIYSLVAALHGGWRSFVLVAAFVTVTKGISMGGSYLFAGYLQPSSLATLGWLLALAGFVRARYVVAGVAAALAGAVHPNFLVLGVGMFTLAAFARRGLALRDHAALLAPQLIVLACFLPQLIDATGPSDHALWILSELHAPGHYSPARLVMWIPAVLSWQVAAGSAMVIMRDIVAARVLWRFSLVAAAIACVTALLSLITPLQFLVQLFAARLAPFAQLACLVIVATALVRGAPLSRARRALFASGVIVPLLAGGWFMRNVLTPPVIAVACVLVLVIALAPRLARIGVTTLAALALGFALVAAHGGGPTTRPAGSEAEHELEDWARTRTDIDALFVIPPELARFRLLARRAVVVDTKSPPLQPDLLEQWYRRLCAVTRLDREGLTPHEIELRYAQLSAADLAFVARSFDADYIVAKRAVTFPQPPVFQNRDYAVYRR
jgi:hypothetical protein